MRFLGIIKAAEGQGQPPKALMDAIAQFTEESFRNGSLIQTGGLTDTKKGARIRMSRGRLKFVDGPFSESKEVVGGFALMEAPTREAAIEHMRRFMQLHVEHWPEFEAECELRELGFLAPDGK